MLPDEKMRWFGQTTYEKYQQQGFPKGCLNKVVLFGVNLEKLPENFAIQESRLYECRVKNQSLKRLDLRGCVMTDCIFDSLQIESLEIADTTIHGTIFLGNRFGRLNLSGAEINHSRMEDCEMDSLHMDGTVLNDTYFYRIEHRTVTGQETVKIVLTGATKEEAENYRQSVKEELLS